MPNDKSAEASLALISIGSNLGERERYISSALELIDQLPKSETERVSSIYKTAPWGVTDQPEFYNLAMGLRTQLSPEHLLSELQNIEAVLERTREQKWGPRTIDLDIVDFDGQVKNSETLKLPHPFFSQREFVLVPLNEIYPSIQISDRSVSSWLNSLIDDKAGTILPEKI